MTTTYTPLYTTTLGSNSSSVTISGFSNAYSDLVLIANVGQVTGNNSFRFQLNSDTGTNYSYTFMQGNGSSYGSGRTANDTSGEVESLIPNSISGNFILNFMNYSNTTSYKTILGRGSSPGQKIDATVTLWRGSTGSSTEAITSIKLYPGGGQSFLSGSTFSLYGVSSLTTFATTKATGGDSIVTSGGYTYHVFRSSGTFTPNQSLSCDYLIVAGGGGAVGGGGGAGGLLTASSQSLSATGYSVTVGAGGTGGAYASSSQTNGNNSVFNSTTTIGGGRSGGTDASPQDGQSGGSGGGAGGAGGTNVGGSGTSGQGYAGGNGATSNGAPYPGGGGGGAGAVGSNATTSGAPYAGNGGIGATSSLINAIASATLTGELYNSNYYYAGGGAGGSGYDNSSNPPAQGGKGGGANGVVSSNNGKSGIANTGGGGGGATQVVLPRTGGNGGSGIVVIRYAV